MKTHAQLSEFRYTLISQYEPTNADICSALDTSRHVQKHAKLGIHAYTCRPSIRACTCIVPMHADAYRRILDACRIIYVRHKRANMDGN